MIAAKTLLIVDDEDSICWGIQQVARSLNLNSQIAGSAEEALAMNVPTTPQLIILDVRLPGMDGLTAMPHFQQRWPQVPIVIITAFGDLETAVSAVRKGAFDYVVKPFDAGKIKSVIERALDAASFGSSERNEPGQPPVAGFVATSPQMQQVFNQIALAANSDANVLLYGESGTGKELAARAIHQFSRRAGAPYVAIHLAALAPELIESELFGHHKGAFTGADRNRSGLLMQAKGGTVLLDEVAEIPLPLQVKLLRVIEQKEITPVGSSESLPCDFRVIAATHRNLNQMVAQGKFRQDLFFRLASFAIDLPPLRDRRDDILPLAQYFLNKLQTDDQRRAVISNEAAEVLLKNPWIGNVRELRNAIEHAAIVSRGQVILSEHLPAPVRFQTADKSKDSQEASTTEMARLVRQWVNEQLQKPHSTAPLHDHLLQHIEPALFQEVLRATQGNVSVAAQILGIHRTTLRRKMDQYGLIDRSHLAVAEKERP